MLKYAAFPKTTANKQTNKHIYCYFYSYKYSADTTHIKYRIVRSSCVAT